MKKLFTFGLVAVIAFLYFNIAINLTSKVEASSVSTSTLSYIEQTLNLLEKQIRSLTQSLTAITAQKIASFQPISSLSVLPKMGETSQNVKVLQTILASQPTIYPEALITGYYGNLTDRALRKFNSHNKTEANDPEATLAYLNVFLKMHPLQASALKGKIEMCAITSSNERASTEVAGWSRVKNGKLIVAPCFGVVPKQIPGTVTILTAKAPSATTSTSTMNSNITTITGTVSSSTVPASASTATTTVTYSDILGAGRTPAGSN